MKITHQIFQQKEPLKKYNEGNFLLRNKYWSSDVTQKSNSLDLEPGVFTWKDPHKIAASLKKSANESTRKKGSAYKSAMSTLNFYINRAGKNLDPGQKEILQKAKQELKKLFGKD